MTEQLSERASEVIRLLDLSKEYYDPNESRSHISGLDHALRLAALLDHRARNSWLPFAGLVHDLARPLNDVYHGEIIAEIVRDRVPGYIYHLLRTHGEYQEAIMHKLPPPVQPTIILKQCKPYNLQKLALMFASCEELTFNPGIEVSPLWTYDVGKSLIIEILN